MTGAFLPSPLAEKCLAHGVSAIALQYPENHDYFGHFKDPHIRVGAWEAEPMPGSAEACIEAVAPDFYIAQAETRRDWQAIVDTAPPGHPYGVVTDFNAFNTPDGRPDAAAAKPLVGAGWTCLTEAYEVQNPPSTPERMAFAAQQRGWAKAQAVAGCYWGFPLSRVVDKVSWVWLAETMTEGDWACWAEQDASKVTS